MRLLSAVAFALLVLLSNCRSPTFPTISARLPAWRASDSTKSFQADVSHPNLSEWEVVDAEVRFSRNRQVEFGNARQLVAPGPLAGPELTLTVPADQDNFSANQIVHFQWKVDFRLRGGQDRISAQTEVQSFRLDCAPGGVEASLAGDQASVLAMVAALPGLNSSLVFTKEQLAAAGLIPTHGFVSFNGMGVAFGNPSATGMPATVPTPRPFRTPAPPSPPIAPPTFGRPGLLMFAPTPGANVTDQIPDDPYTLIGWGYGFDFTSATRPVFPCIPHEAWFIHEAGYHPASGGFIATPPSESAPGTVAVGSPTSPPPLAVPPTVAWHRRIWDLHVWRMPGSAAPVLGITRPTGTGIAPELPTNGLTAASGDFFEVPLPAP